MGWTCEKERREAASVIPVDTYLTRRRLQWGGHVRRRGERQRVSSLWTHTSREGGCSGMGGGQESTQLVPSMISSGGI